MNTSILDHLESLYGSEQAGKVGAALSELMQQYGAKLPAPKKNLSGLALSEKDALVITYGDQVTASNEPPLRTLASFFETHVSEVISGVHVLPFYPSSSDDGFSVIDYLQIDPALGSWDDVSRLGTRFDLMFDAVFNHISARSEWFQRFLDDDAEYREYFVTVEGEPDLSAVVRPRALPLLTQFETPSGVKKVWTTFSADQVDVNVRNPTVLLRLIDALLLYVSQGARFIRLDAIAYLWKEAGTNCIHLPQTHCVIQLFRAVLDQLAPQVMLITETNVPHVDNISYFGDGTNEAQLVYNFALPPLVLHSLATSDATALTKWAQSLELPSKRVTFFNFLASHDGIGVNPARGILSLDEIDALVQRTQDHGGLVSYKHNSDGSKSPYELNISYFDALSNPANNEPIAVQINRFICAQAIMLSLAGMPGIYFHSLFGSRNDRSAADASGIPRRINRQKFQRKDLERELGDTSSLRAQVLARFKALLAQRRGSPAFHPTGRQDVIACDKQVFVVLRSSPDRREHALCFHNVSGHEVKLRNPITKEVKKCFAEGGAELPEVSELNLAPYEVRWMTTFREL